MSDYYWDVHPSDKGKDRWLGRVLIDINGIQIRVNIQDKGSKERTTLWAKNLARALNEGKIDPKKFKLYRKEMAWYEPHESPNYWLDEIQEVAELCGEDKPDGVFYGMLYERGLI